MLDAARRRIAATDPRLLERATFLCAPLGAVSECCPAASFDLVLAHTILEYVPDPWQALRGLVSVLAPGGSISLLMTNPHADALRWAVRDKDLTRARESLSEGASPADLFGLPRRTLALPQVREALNGSGIRLVAHHGVRIFADCIDSDKLQDGAFLSDLRSLEIAASGLEPYIRIARYHHLVGVCRADPDAPG